jgi:hypothetical protein
VKPEVRNARLPARRSKGMFDIPHVPAVPVAEHKPGFLRHLRQGSVKGIIDRDYPRSVVLGDRQNDEATLQRYVAPAQSQDSLRLSIGKYGIQIRFDKKL